MITELLSYLTKLFQPYSEFESVVIVISSLVIMILLTVVHELGHLIPSRIFTSSGRLEFLPFRRKPGIEKWFVVAACNIPDDIKDRISKTRMGIIILAGPLLDFIASAFGLVIGMQLDNCLGVALVFGAGFRAVFAFLNFLPFGITDGGQFIKLVKDGTEAEKTK